MRIIKPIPLTLTACSVSETDAIDGPVWSSSTTYSTGDRVRYNHVTYQSADDGNVGKQPDLYTSGEDAMWLVVGATMPYRMLDDYVETVTQPPSAADLTFTVSFSRGDSIGLLNVVGTDVHVTVVSSDSEVTLDTSYSLQEDITSLSLYEYFNLPIVRKDIVDSMGSFSGIPMTYDGTLTVTIKTDGELIPCIGHVIVGMSDEIGETKYGAEVGITDYSKKSTDDFGVTSLVKRSFAKTASLSLFVPPYRSDRVVVSLTDARATPILISASSEYSALQIYGWIEDWRMVYEGPNETEIRVEVQGLI